MIVQILRASSSDELSVAFGPGPCWMPRVWALVGPTTFYQYISPLIVSVRFLILFLYLSAGPWIRAEFGKKRVPH